MSHYCKICGCNLPNEKFSGKGHAAHICKQCAKIPPDKRSELETITRINNLSPWMSKKDRAWLQKMMNDKRDNVRLAAESAWKCLFTPIHYEEEWEPDEYEEHWPDEYEEQQPDEYAEREDKENVRHDLNDIVFDDDDLPF